MQFYFPLHGNELESCCQSMLEQEKLLSLGGQLSLIAVVLAAFLGMHTIRELHVNCQPAHHAKFMYCVSPKIRQGLILIFAPKKRIRAYFQGRFYFTVMSSSGLFIYLISIPLI